MITMQVLNGGSYTENTPKIAVDTANVVHDIARFYEVKNYQFYLDAYLTLNTNTRIDLNYDNGLKSEKRIRSKAFMLGITQLASINRDHHITFAAATKLGGKVTEIPCTDESGMDKKFFCDNLATLEPFGQPKHIRNTKLSVNYRYRF